MGTIRSKYQYDFLGNFPDGFAGIRLSGELEGFLAESNPWWQGKPMRPLPPFRRWLFEHVLQHLKDGLVPVTLLCGPRQVGKTTLQEQIIDHLLCQEEVNPRRIFHVRLSKIPSLKGLSDPILTLCRWFAGRILGGSFNEWAHKGEPVFLFFDAVENLSEWAPQIEALVSQQDVRVMVTENSGPSGEQGRDSLAGHVSRLELSPLLLREIASLREGEALDPLLPLNGVKELKEKDFWEALRQHGSRHRGIRDKAFAAFSERGGFPVAQDKAERPWSEMADHLNETVIRCVLEHDLRSGEFGKRRDQKLLEETFRLSCHYAGQAPGPPILLNELRLALSANIGWNRALAYLRFLDDTLLIRLVEPLELKLKRRKVQPKICLCDHTLRASWLQQVVPITPDGLRHSPQLTDLAAHLARSITGCFLSGIPGLRLSWFPERGLEPEVDFVLTVGEHRIPLQVRYQQQIDGHYDTLGPRAFLEKTVYNAPFGLLVTLSDEVSVADPRIVALPLSSLLLMR